MLHVNAYACLLTPASVVQFRSNPAAEAQFNALHPRCKADWRFRLQMSDDARKNIVDGFALPQAVAELKPEVAATATCALPRCHSLLAESIALSSTPSSPASSPTISGATSPEVASPVAASPVWCASQMMHVVLAQTSQGHGFSRMHAAAHAHRYAGTETRASASWMRLCALPCIYLSANSPLSKLRIIAAPLLPHMAQRSRRALHAGSPHAH